MNRVSLIIPVLFILWCSLPVHAQTGFPGVDAFLKSTLKADERVSIWARGDLNGDKLEDWVGVIHRQHPDSSPTYQIYVLVRLREGGFQVAEKSIEEEIPGMGCCWVEDLKIQRSSIYIQNNAKTASVMEAVTHQFKLYKGEWRLIGIKSYLTDFTPSAPATVDTEMNMLTGLIIEKTQERDEKPVSKSRRKRFPTFLLKDFDFSIRFGNE